MPFLLQLTCHLAGKSADTPNNCSELWMLENKVLKYQQESLTASGDLARHLLDKLGETFLSAQNFAWAQLASARGLTPKERKHSALAQSSSLMERSYGLLNDDGSLRPKEDCVSTGLDKRLLRHRQTLMRPRMSPIASLRPPCLRETRPTIETLLSLRARHCRFSHQRTCQLWQLIDSTMSKLSV